MNNTNTINPPRTKFEYMEGGVTDAGLAGNDVGEGNVGSAVAG
jgi:hypothetical protein